MKTTYKINKKYPWGEIIAMNKCIAWQKEIIKRKKGKK